MSVCAILRVCVWLALLLWPCALQHGSNNATVAPHPSLAAVIVVVTVVPVLRQVSWCVQVWDVVGREVRESDTAEYLYYNITIICTPE